MNCPICEKHQNRKAIIDEKENWVISHGPLSSQLLGYIYLEPKRHVEDWAQFTEEELAEMGALMKEVEEAIQKILPIDRLYMVAISEAVRHLHVHLIPREEGMKVKGTALIEQATQQKVKSTATVTHEQLEQFCNQLRIQLSI
ncbi:HIT family protein [Oceanobacillus senegalensis]|uniref:HIT family protein n=1 Tax=Oceanobacillus senegalensis TaxID=1936063 RepID=UPI000A3083D7|nr:HIT domain-containing protein [Oceanobacillus senegalensis]